MIRTFDELDAKIKSCTEALNGKIDGSAGKRAIVVCGDTACLSSNAGEIIARLHQLVEEKGLGDRVSVDKVGCFGYCSQGPFV